MNLLKVVRFITIASVFAVMLAGFTLPGIASAQIGVGISVGFGPPELPVYEQPICPGDGYIWTPGYWAWDDDVQDYYWVPGTWVLAPQPGYLWTPGYWGWGGNAFFFHEGYWGPVVGFYGGIDYGFGYTGRGYYGGRWDHDHFYYNREVNHIDDREIRNVYNERVENNVNVARVSYNGGNGGVNARATAQEETAARERHVGPVAAQTQHFQAARSNPELRASQNHGKPPIAATSRPGSFSGGGVVAARSGGNYNPPANRGGNSTNRPPAADTKTQSNNRVENNNNRAENNPNRPPTAGTARTETNTNRAENNRTYTHASEVPKHTAPEVSNPNPKYQQQQEKLNQKQAQDHQKLQQQQERDHQRATQQNANAAKQQQLEQRHQQQTQQMEQKHQQQQEKVQRSAQPRQQAPPKQSEEKKPH
jgi:hypothetical protein